MLILTTSFSYFYYYPNSLLIWAPKGFLLENHRSRETFFIRSAEQRLGARLRLAGNSCRNYQTLPRSRTEDLVTTIDKCYQKITETFLAGSTKSCVGARSHLARNSCKDHRASPRSWIEDLVTTMDKCYLSKHNLSI